MAIITAANFDYKGPLANFERDSYATLSDMVNVNENYLPNIFIGVCEETGKAYLFNKSNEVDPTLGKWREIVGGTDITDYIRKTNDFSTFEPMYDGEIVQYIGDEESGEDYVHGYFYEATLIEESGEDPYYIYTQIDIQPATDLIWGNITGTLSDQTDLQSALNQKIDKYAVLPDVSTVDAGLIVEYVGETTGKYVNGYFYQPKISEFHVDNHECAQYTSMAITDQVKYEAFVDSLTEQYGEKPEYIKFTKYYGPQLYVYSSSDLETPCTLPDGASQPLMGYGMGSVVGLGMTDQSNWQGMPFESSIYVYPGGSLEWAQKDVQPSVHPSTEHEIVYGTDAQGNQTVYDINNFGLVDDVLVNGESVVTNKVASIDLTNRIRRITDPVNTVPEYEYEITEYVGTTTESYTNGYFYKGHQEDDLETGDKYRPYFIATIVDKEKLFSKFADINNQFGITADRIQIHVHIAGGMENTTFIVNAYTGTTEYAYVDGEHALSVSEVESEFGVSISLDPSGPGGFSTGDYVDINVVKLNFWERVDVQPSTEVIDNVMTQSSTSALSANMGYELQQQISQLQGLGRYLSVWDCTTGLPQTDPTVIPYEYRAGDYYIVGNVVKAEPESLTGTQIVGEGLSLTIDPDTSRQNRFYTDLKRLIGEPLTDVDIYAVYTKNAVTSIKSSSASGDTSTVTLSRQGSAYVKQLEVKALLESMEISDYESFIGTSIRVHSEGSKGKILVYGVYRSTEGYDTQTTALEVYTRETKDGEDPVEGIKKIIEDEWYIKITGDLVLGPVWSCTVYKLNIGDSGSPINWVYDINIGGTRTSWLDPFIIEGTPEEGDIVRVSYRTEKINYKPDGTEYTGEPSIVIEDREVGIDDSYIYDGLVWHLLSNGKKEITFTEIVGSPYDNTELANALYSLEVETDNETIHSNLEDELEVIGIKSTDSSYATMKVWKGLKADYNLLTKDANTIYIITDER